MEIRSFRLKGLKKISLNRWYASEHWKNRAEIKKDYAWLIKSMVRGKFPRDKKYICEYILGFKKAPLDATNTIAMVKMIEDCIFESDTYNVVLSVTISSVKAKEDYVDVKVTILD